MLLKLMTWMMATVVGALQLAAQQASPRAVATSGFQISGTLVDATTSQPVQRARVSIASVTQRDNATTVITREDGRFSFTNLVSGKYSLTAQARGYLLQSFNQHEGFSSAIAVGPNLESNDLLFRLPPEGAISGVVVDEAGEPVREADVMLYFTGLSGGQQATRPFGRASTNDEGAYRFGHLPPGRYLVAVATRPWYAQNQPRAVFVVNDRIAAADLSSDPQLEQLDVAYPITFNGGVTDVGEASPIILRRGDKVTADVNLQPVRALHIRLPREDPNHAGYTIVEMRLFDGALGVQNRAFRQGEDDVVSVPPGHYALRHLAASSGLFPNDGNGVAEVREVDINADGEINKSQGSANVPVSAKVQFDPGTASGQVSLQLLNKKSRQVTAERMESNGEVVFKQGVAPGIYEISLASSSGLYVKSASAAETMVTGRTIEIRPGSAVKLTINATIGEGEVKGTALREGKSFAGAMIVLAPADPVHNQALFRRDQSDTDGSFTLSAVVPGDYTLLAIENGWDLEWLRPEVLKNYMGAGAAVQVQANGKYNVKVPVQ